VILEGEEYQCLRMAHFGELLSLHVWPALIVYTTCVNIRAKKREQKENRTSKFIKRFGGGGTFTRTQQCKQ